MATLINRANILAAFAQHGVTDEQASKLAGLIRYANTPDDVDKALEYANEITEAHGVEDIRAEGLWNGYYCDIACLYVNMGDPYVTTLVYDVDNEQFIICGYGDWVESAEDAGIHVI